MVGRGVNDMPATELHELFSRCFPAQENILRQLLDDVCRLYNGEWSQWQACQVAYHNIEHIQAVLRVALQIMAGHSKLSQQPIVTTEVKIVAAAAMFHDSGYLKEKNDLSGGCGGQYTFEHVERSQLLAQSYLVRQPDWSVAECQAVVAIIGATQMSSMGEQSAVLPPEFAGLAQMVASADLLAQMADENYLQKLPHLYAEFAEAYAAQGRSFLRRRGFMVFDSYEQLLASSADFIHKQVLPRLLQLGNWELALQCYFATQPSPYMQQLLLNLHQIETLAKQS